MRHAISALLLLPALATAGPPVRLSVGFNFGHPMPYYRPYVVAPYYYRPYPYYVAPAPVIYEPAPVVVRQPVVVEQQPSYSSPVVQSTPAPPLTQVSAQQSANADQFLNQLGSGDDVVRQNAVMELGRMKADRAVDSLTATLAGDRSPQVREAAARALGLIAAPRSLTALTHAAQADTDRDVRHSAQFAVEIIRANLRTQ